MAVNKLITQNKYTPLAASTALVGRSTKTPLDDTQTTIVQTSNYDSAGRLASRAAIEALSLDTSNPPFQTSTARLSNPNITSGPQMVSRGFIRRADPTDASDPTGKYRLRFMYNPEAIQRSYISYLDQQALDPFNTINGSANKSAAPGILDFSFEMIFDRQVENAQDATHQGALVDFAYFDLVVRGVVPSANQHIPDNGIMMVNPRDIVIVFSDQFTVRGRPYNARVNYEKFAHDMTPTRIRITLMVKAMYVGPQLPALETPSTREQLYKSTVPYESAKLNISYYTPTSDAAGVAAMIAASGYEVTTTQPGGGSGGGTGGSVGGGSGGGAGSGTAVNPSIMGPNSVTVADIERWWNSLGKGQPSFASVRQLATWYLEFGQSEGVRGDLAFAQACWECAYFSTGNARNSFNFAGIAHYDGQSHGASFSGPQQGVLAQIQLLKKAVNGNRVALANPDVTVNWGGNRKIVYLSDLGGSTNASSTWATDPNYARGVGSVFGSLLRSSTRSLA